MKGTSEGKKKPTGGFSLLLLKSPLQLLTSSAGFGWAPCGKAFEDVAKAQGLDHGNTYACE